MSQCRHLRHGRRCQVSGVANDNTAAAGLAPPKTGLSELPAGLELVKTREIAIRTLGKEHIGTLMTTFNLAHAYFCQHQQMKQGFLVTARQLNSCGAMAKVISKASQ